MESNQARPYVMAVVRNPVSSIRRDFPCREDSLSLQHVARYAFSALFAVSSMLEVYGFLGLFTLWLDAEGVRLLSYLLGCEARIPSLRGKT